MQPNNNDSRIYAIALATSLARGDWPVDTLFHYEQNKMRSHLLRIFQSVVISNFPKDINDSTSVLSDLTWKKSKRKYDKHDEAEITSDKKRLKCRNI